MFSSDLSHGNSAFWAPFRHNFREEESGLMIRDSPLPEGSPLWKSCVVIIRKLQPERDGMGLSLPHPVWLGHGAAPLCASLLQIRKAVHWALGGAWQGLGNGTPPWRSEGSSWKPVRRSVGPSAVCCVERPPTPPHLYHQRHRHLMRQTPFLKKLGPKEMKRLAPGHMACEIQT